jgi:uncharacterized membrane protein SpoIIM required for sporulation
MRESKFVEQNKEKWANFEADLRSKKKDPHKLRAQLVEITDDLSFARTFYKNRSVRVYLNYLGQQVYNNIYKNRRDFLKSLGVFFREDIPRIVYHSRKELLISFLVLLLSVTIGIFSSAKDEGFARSILGDGYVEQTLDNIRKGDPLAIYKSSSQGDMFTYIALNNLKVSLIVFIFGLIASYGSMVIMVHNGIMLGVFMYFFYSRGLSTDFNFTVWMHGTIEMLTLVIETVAGMLLGRGLVYPGTLSRMKAFTVWGRRGAMLFLSTVPFIVFAAFIESFLTRYTEMPNLLRGLLILLSVAVMVFYFVLFPYSKFSGTKDVELGMPELKAETGLEFKTGVIYSNGLIFLKAIQIFSSRFAYILRFTFFTGISYILLMALLNFKENIRSFKLLDIQFEEFVINMVSSRSGKFIDLFGNLSLLFNTSESLLMYALSSAWISALAYFALTLISGILPSVPFRKTRALLCAVIFSLLINLLMLSDSVWMACFYIVISPLMLVLLANAVFNINGKNPVSSIRDYFSSGFSRMNGLWLLLVLITFFGLIFIISPFSYLAIWLMEMNVELSEETYTITLQMLMLLAFILLMSFVIVFYIVQCVLLSFSLHEINSAEGLGKGIEDIGKTRKAYGIETE